MRFVPVALLLLALGIALLLLRRRKPPAPAPEPKAPEPLDAEAPSDDELRDFVDRKIAEGFDPEDSIAEAAVEVFEMEEPDERLARMVDESMARHREAQKSWPSTTDCDRLDRCFEELAQDGIVARQNFTCCQTCGHAEIGMEIEEAKKRGAVSGYAFYHQQDTERAAEGGGVFLAYGSVSGEEPKTLEIAQRLVTALERSGLKVAWDGSTGSRIQVELDWKKRR